MLTLKPMTETDLQQFLVPLLAEYAQAHVDDGQWTAVDAPEKARQEIYGLLFEGAATPNHYLFTLVNAAGQLVGALWFAVREQGQRTAFVYDIRVDEAFRRHGYASQAFLAMEEKVRALGIGRIALHVFGNNYAARAMYEKLGYEPTNIMMAKTLDPQ